MPKTIDALTVTEQTELDERESRIENGLKAFYEVGQELIAIRDRKLYRATYQTFEAYLQERWQMSRSRGYELMSASEVIENLSDMPDKPENARQADALSKAPADQQQQAWTEAVATAPNGKPTAAHVSDVVKRLTNPQPLQVEQTATVVEESSPYKGQTVTVKRTEGAIAICETEGGESYPFLSTELQPDQPATPHPTPHTPHPTPKLSEAAQLRSLLQRILEVATGIPDDLLAEAH